MMMGTERGSIGPFTSTQSRSKRNNTKPFSFASRRAIFLLSLKLHKLTCIGRLLWERGVYLPWQI